MFDKKEDDFYKALEEKEFIVLTVVGTSMLPMLRQRVDSVVLTKVDRPIKKYDCVLYKLILDGKKKYVLHRIIKIKKGKYIICGDNLWRKEDFVTDDMIIALMSGFYRKEKYVSINSFWYVVYYHLACFFRPLRFITHGIKKVFRIIFKRKKKEE